MTKVKNTSIKSYIKNGEKYYMFKVYLGIDPLTGNPKYTTRRNFKTPGEATLELSKIKVSVRDGTYLKKRVETFKDVYNLWVVQYERTVEESTFVKTIGLFRNHILPAIGMYKIDKINFKICEDAVNKWSDELKNFRMVKSYAAKVLNYAIKHDYIQKNPFSLVDLPKNRKKIRFDDDEKQANFYTKEQLLAFLNCMKQETNFKAYALFRLLSFSGMRKGEALALTWNDLNFTTNELRINKALSRGKNNRLYVKSTKTGDTRTIKMDDKTITVMKEWKKQQKQDYLGLGFNTMQPKQLVFSNEVNEYLQPTQTRKWILHVQKKYNLGTITTHGLRHTHCSLLFEAGASLKEVQDRLGHSDVKTTMNIYAHVTKKAKEEAILKFANYIEM